PHFRTFDPSLSHFLHGNASASARATAKAAGCVHSSGWSASHFFVAPTPFCKVVSGGIQAVTPFIDVFDIIASSLLINPSHQLLLISLSAVQSLLRSPART